MIFPNVQGETDGARFMGRFQEAMQDATPADMAAQVLSACQFVEHLKYKSEDTRDRVNNATYAICYVTRVLVGRAIAAERAADARAHAEKAREEAAEKGTQ